MSHEILPPGRESVPLRASFFYDRYQKVSQLHYDFLRKNLVFYHDFALFPGILVGVLSVVFKTLSLSHQEDPRTDQDWHGRGRSKTTPGGARGGRSGWLFWLRRGPPCCPILPLRMFPSPSPTPSVCGWRPIAGSMMRVRGGGRPPVGFRPCSCCGGWWRAWPDDPPHPQTLTY